MPLNSLFRLLPFGRRRRAPIVPVLRLSGTIGRGSALRRGLTLEGLADPLERGFRQARGRTLALVINSPGGAPAQTALIHRRIVDLKAEHRVQVIAFVEDVAASGGYWLACAADEIVADPASLVGSIGVVSAGFGFTGLMERVGVERRVYTAGTRKSMLDPFRPEDPADVAHLRALQDELHEQFKTAVLAARGTRLNGDESLFSGAFWTGGKAKDLGLVDALGELRSTLRARFGEGVRLRPVPPRQSWSLLPWSRPGPGAEPESRRARAGLEAAAAIDALLEVAEERALWSRFGL